MKILIVGSGAREHAIAKALIKSRHHPNLVCFGSSNNPGIKALICHPERSDSEVKDPLTSEGILRFAQNDKYTIGKLTDTEAIISFAIKNTIDWAIVGPEGPLAAGVVDALAAKNNPCVGPTIRLAQIESSKSFARDLLSYHHVPGLPEYKRLESTDGVKEFTTQLHDSYVVKADGLMSGKGVKVYGEHLHSLDETLAFIAEITANGDPFVIEEKFVGEEFSLMSFCDGTHLAHMPAVQDHKRAHAGDTGPNTGGMGTYSDTNHSLPFLNASDIAQAQKINELTAQALHTQFSEPYKGILYGGFMATKDGVNLIEYNARFGDPECMNVLSILKTDFVDVCQAIIHGTLDTLIVEFDTRATVCKYAVPEGYPDDPVKNQPIDVSAVSDKNCLYYAGVDERDGQLYETGSRTVAVLGLGETLAVAEQQAEKEIERITGPVFHRPDIGTAALLQKRIESMKKIRA